MLCGPSGTLDNGRSRSVPRRAAGPGCGANGRTRVGGRARRDGDVDLATEGRAEVGKPRGRGRRLRTVRAAAPRSWLATPAVADPLGERTSVLVEVGEKKKKKASKYA